MEPDDIELRDVKINSPEEPESDCGGGAASGDDDTSETGRCLNGQNNTGNGEAPCSQMRDRKKNHHQKNDALSRIKRELNEEVCGNVRLWMIILFIFVLIIAVILISLALCTALYRDKDEEFDRSLFTVPQYFNGSFQMSSNLSAAETQILKGLQIKLADLYSSSPALGRYFSKAETRPFGNRSAVVQYKLTFVLPEEHLWELRNFTLSREMVQNVFRQFLYDQDSDESGNLFIDPLSLKMSVMP